MRHTRNTGFVFGLMLFAGWPAAGQNSLAVRVMPYRAAAKATDLAELPELNQVRLTGWLGERVTKNESVRLVNVDLEPLLAGYKKKPGSHPWIGEHIGKWMHASTLAWVNTGDARLRTKLDGAARELIAAQEPDGYLGTYTPDKRFGLYDGADWDVWSHKYCLLGLLTYYRYTGDKAALAASRKAADLLIRTFGPGKKSILSAGTHIGMAATSVLEPVVLLYRATGETRYLEFAKYIVDSWDEPNGPGVLKTLTTVGKVNKTANGKAYEMLSNLVGLCELYRATGDRKYLVPTMKAWKDITANQLYITGSASHGEHFHDDHDLPNAPGTNIGETCVTVTWIQLNSQLLRLTGEAKYADELERSYYNHLAAAQRPDGAEWCYYTALEGTKPYTPGINCCVSSGPRGMAMAPLHAYLRLHKGGKEALAVGLFDSSQADLTLNGKTVRVEQQSEFPMRGLTRLTLHLKQPATFPLYIRAPKWGGAWTVTLNNDGSQSKTSASSHSPEWLLVGNQRWKEGDTVTVQCSLGVGQVAGDFTNKGKSALTWGPLVLAYDVAKNPGLPQPIVLSLAPRTDFDRGPGHPVPGQTLAFTAKVKAAAGTAERNAIFVPFAEAGASGSRYRVWLGAPGTTSPAVLSLTFGAVENRSRPGNIAGSLADGDPSTFVVTFDGKPAAEDWFAVTLDKPASVRRITFAHGRAFHDGGWFDASAGKPRVEIQKTPNGPWEAVGLLETYPATTATEARGLQDGQTFTLVLPEAVAAVAIRIVGKPAHGDNPSQAFASCAELQAFEK